MISTHILDAGRGIPAIRVPVQLDVFITGYGWREVGHGVTNADGDILNFEEPEAPGVYRLMFDVAAYQPDSFFPSVSVTFEIRNTDEHYHLPLVLSPFGYTAYRDNPGLA
jgi:5-hydroxyisourate hydrolase